MAVTAGRSPIVMDTVGDSWPPLGSNERLPLKISNIRVVNAAAAGTVRLLDVPGGKMLFLRTTMPANDSDNVTLPARDGWYDTVYVDALPTGAVVFLHYE